MLARARAMAAQQLAVEPGVRNFVRRVIAERATLTTGACPQLTSQSCCQQAHAADKVSLSWVANCHGWSVCQALQRCNTGMLAVGSPSSGGCVRHDQRPARPPTGSTCYASGTDRRRDMSTPDRPPRTGFRV